MALTGLRVVGEAMDFFLDKYFIAQIRENNHLGAKIEANL